MSLQEIRRAVRREADPVRAKVFRGFFKTGPGEYGEGDRFLGLTVPIVRGLVRRFREAPISHACALARSPIHEERLLGLLLLVDRFKRGDERRAYAAYVSCFRHINNWDLVDVTAEHIVGGWLHGRSRSPLTRWAASKNLWERRIAVLTTFHFIKKGEFQPTLDFARRLLKDPHDLIHKALGWMLREIGKRDRPILEKFLVRHHARMPRTMLRYAIERLPERRRLAFLKGKVGPL